MKKKTNTVEKEVKKEIKKLLINAYYQGSTKRKGRREVNTFQLENIDKNKMVHKTAAQDKLSRHNQRQVAMMQTDHGG